MLSCCQAETVDRFFGFWKNTIEFSAKKEQVDQDRKLDPETYELDGVRVSYDVVRKWQQITHVGVLTDDEKNRILGKIQQPDADASQPQKEAYNNFVELINLIASESQPQPKEFFDKYFEGFLTYDDLFGPASPTLSEQARRHKIFATILPFVQQKLIRQYIVQTLATNLSADPSLVEQLLTNNKLLTVSDSTTSNNNNSPDKPPVIDAFTALGYRGGVDARFFDNGGTRLGQTITVQTVDTSISLDNIPIKPNGSG